MGKKRIKAQPPAIRIKHEELAQTGEQIADSIKLESAQKAMRDRSKKPLSLKPGQSLQLTKSSTATDPESGSTRTTKSGSQLRKRSGSQFSDAQLNKMSKVLSSYSAKVAPSVRGASDKFKKKIKNTSPRRMAITRKRVAVGAGVGAGVAIGATALDFAIGLFDKFDEAKSTGTSEVKVGGARFTINPA